MNAMKITFPRGASYRTLCVLVGLMAIVFAGIALSQSGSPVMISNVFDPDLADVKPVATQAIKDAVSKAKASEDGCYPPPLATFTAQVPASGDSSFQAALGKARADALQQALAALGNGPDKVNIGYGTGNSDNVLVNYKPGKDTDAPRMKVTSIPNKGTKVKAGDKIRVTIVASERYADGHKSWPTGVHSIQLTANDGLVDSKDYGKPPQPCARQTLETTYTVPNHPPPVIHLHALAEDGVGNHGGEDADFPTGDKWEGSWHATGIHDSQRYGRGGNVRHEETLNATFAFYVSGDGVISGEGRAAVDQPPGVADDCTWTRSPQHFDVPVHITGKSSTTVDGQPLFTLELKPDNVSLAYTAKCPKASSTTNVSWPSDAESQCGWRVTMLAKDPSTKEEETLHACGPNNMTQIKVTIHRAPP
ncbi:MAG TPA: hypothetical protein VLK27_04055 [Chthoniobacterales bacterium]|nr:hypothetical protein [Chthoniobacterales bacterium]